MTRLMVVYQSERGHTAKLAEGVAAGARSVPGVECQSCALSWDDVTKGRFANDKLFQALDECDAIVFGCATYMGSGSALFKAFLEAAFRPSWLEQRWKDKIAAGFTNSASQSGDKLSTLFQLAVFAMQMSMIWVGVGDLPGNNWSGGSRNDLNRLGSWMGIMGQSNADEDGPSVGDIDTAYRLGARVASIGRRFKEGTPFQTDRISEPEFRRKNVERSKAVHQG
ncbi:flavodoxin family protein [Acidobacteria bacterium AB60]|nr:flavodoxin family protein [Acidobacteria bacterium AB60]